MIFDLAAYKRQRNISYTQVFEDGADIIKNPSFCYVRLDREELPDISKSSSLVIDKGYTIVGEDCKNKIVLISHGKMLHRCLGVYENDTKMFSCVNLFRSKPFPQDLPKKIYPCNCKNRKAWSN